PRRRLPRQRHRRAAERAGEHRVDPCLQLLRESAGEWRRYRAFRGGNGRDRDERAGLDDYLGAVDRRLALEARRGRERVPRVAQPPCLERCERERRTDELERCELRIVLTTESEACPRCCGTAVQLYPRLDLEQPTTLGQ